MSMEYSAPHLPKNSLCCSLLLLSAWLGGWHPFFLTEIIAITFRRPSKTGTSKQRKNKKDVPKGLFTVTHWRVLLPKCPCWTHGLPCVVYFLSWIFCVSLLLREGNGVCVYVVGKKGRGREERRLGTPVQPLHGIRTCKFLNQKLYCYCEFRWMAVSKIHEVFFLFSLSADSVQRGSWNYILKYCCTEVSVWKSK